MLSRSDLERIVETGEDWEKVDTYEFRRVAPALAVACLDALAFISWYSDSDDSMSAERQEKEDLVPRMRAALAAAGVAPGPEGGA